MTGDALAEESKAADAAPKKTSTPPRRRGDVVNLTFEDLSYVTSRRLGRGSKCILQKISGDFRAGELTAIMGPSGAGKSTLMNILAGFTTHGVTGCLLDNGAPRVRRVFWRHSCYITQDDQLQPLLSVAEAMRIASELKLSRRELSRQQAAARVEDIMTSLGLSEKRHTKIKNLSGGQRKRLCIALELVNNPQVMFFDEPTTGLDSSSCIQCVSLLKELARAGRTVVCSVHQPSATLLQMFDHLYVLAEGSCVYQGGTKGMVSFLSGLGLECPPYHNPADFILEIATGDYGPHKDKLTNAIENGKCNDWRRRAAFDYSNSIVSSDIVPYTPLRAPQLPPVYQLSLGTDQQEPGSRTSSHRKEPSWDYPTSFCLQFYVLLKRTFLLLYRDKSLTQMRLVMHVIVGIIIGMLYFRIGNDANEYFNNFGFLFFSLMFLMFTAFSAMLLAFPLEIPILRREYFNRWYSLHSYYIAITFADVPVQTVCSVGYCVAVYFLTAQPVEFFRLFLFTLSCSVVAVVAQSIGLIIGVSLSIQNGTIFGPLTIMPFFVFSGFLVRMRDSPVYFHWLFHTSFLKYGVECCAWAVYGYNRSQLECREVYCHYKTPEQFLKFLDMPLEYYWFNIGILVVMFFILRLISFLILLFRLNRNR
ncbi:ATP-binding cassette sub-family G member 4-like [Bacillus rossius redtenbacheri]|uniref:ATP-binding cassette sub-family G member 4-like n=1 Tax=Bacillus rossius redtenbacheri TaxID=93214 RepID=UPI002FDE4ABE